MYNYFKFTWPNEYVEILAETVQELEATLKVAIQTMKNSNYPVAAINSGCELFLRFITFAAIDTSVSMNIECVIFTI